MRAAPSTSRHAIAIARALGLVLALPVALPLALGGCAVTSTITVPPCVDRIAVVGEHQRVGRTLSFDHSFDAPGTRTDLVITGRGGEERTVSLWNNQPDGGRLFAGVLGVVGGAIAWTVAGYEVTQNGAGFDDEVPFYGVVFGAVAVGVGAALALTGWHPKEPPAWGGLCEDVPR